MCRFPNAIAPSLLSPFLFSRYVEDLADEEVLVFQHTKEDGTVVTAVDVPDTPHAVAPVPKLLRRCTIARYETWVDEVGSSSGGGGGSTIGEASGTGGLGKQLQQGVVTVV